MKQFKARRISDAKESLKVHAQRTQKYVDSTHNALEELEDFLDKVPTNSQGMNAKKKVISDIIPDLATVSNVLDSLKRLDISIDVD